jgi:hypothetical protein
MPPDHDHFSGAQTDWIACQLRKFPQLSYHPAEQARGTR